MSKIYKRVKKFRELKKLGSNSVNRVDFVNNDGSENNPESVNSIQQQEENSSSAENVYNSDNDSNGSVISQTECHRDDNDHNSSEFSYDNSDTDSESVIDETVNVNESFKKKLRQWALKNINSLQLNVISELLILLREEGHPTLPKTAQALLQTKHHHVSQSIVSLKGSNCDYKYLGIENGLKKIISPNIFVEHTIEIMVHIDGMQIYKNSQIQLWPITVKIFNEKYMTHPFIAAIYCGDSKPADVNEYLSDFIEESKKLINSGISIDGKKYDFKLIAIIADSQARTYIKCCKAAGTFYACERCITKGVSVGEKRKKKRVYSEMDCQLRTKKSFKKQTQAEHHKGDFKSLLTTLPGFDPVKHVVLDSMHLLYLGIMKNLLESWILRKSKARLRNLEVKLLRLKLLSLTPFVSSEFQRKKFDINDLAKWKATQYRFVLLYCGPVVLKNTLSKQLYDHFLLLFVACRILHCKDLMIKFNNYAKELLRKLFFLLPSLYGEQSQTSNYHNLIHLADDALNLNLPLSDISAFWGENHIGKINKLVKSPYQPLTQILNRLSELEHEEKLKIKKHYIIKKCVIDEVSEHIIYEEIKYVIIKSLSRLTNCW
ncbi:uncharacterized protein LOC141531799 isoform X2 [Cotesia typhae]|uniref:uncharacterized protein LOC141531799 isoform X2 n=1 Tax=Cotesia typhae TaxID=2053667 RepID=UPI003D699234